MKKFLLVVSLLLVSCGTLYAGDVGSLASFDQAVRSKDALINLTGDVTLSAVSSDYTIDYALTITGNGRALDGGSLHRIFKIQGGSTVVFDNVKIQKAGATTSEALSISGGTLVFRGGSSFSDNTGRAVDISGGTVTFEGTSFLRNSSGGDGGALKIASGATVNYTGTILFDGNRATGRGGAIYTESSTFSPTESTTFRNNTASSDGGALYGTGVITITAGIFEANTTAANGGAVWGQSVTVNPTIAPMTFNSNKATGINSRGGALYSNTTISAKDTTFNGNEAHVGGATSSTGRSTIENCVFGNTNGNVARLSGGAVHAEAVAAEKTSFISNNSSGGFGGAVFLDGSSGVSTFYNCMFSKNQSSQDGGAIYLTGANHETSILRSYFDSNYSASGRGGALSLAGSITQLNQCAFTGNYVQASSSASGGAALISSSAYKVVNCTFVKNKAASGKGGAVFLAGTAGNNSSVKSVIMYSTFVDNEAGGGSGGGLYTAAASLNLSASAFVGNIASYGSDVFRDSGTINSHGYNIIGNYGITGSSGTPNTDFNWAADTYVTGDRVSDVSGSSNTRALVFGSSTLAANTTTISAGATLGTILGTTHTIDTVALVDSTATAINPALDRMSESVARNIFSTYFTGIDHSDARGVARPVPTNGNCDIGAFESGSGTTPPTPGTDIIASVIMSGIPNTMTMIGQTCSLTATVRYQNGISASIEPVIWASSNPGVARIDQFGSLVSLRQGTTTISVTTVNNGVGGRPATNTKVLSVSDQQTYTNIHPDVWRRMADFNAKMGSYFAQIYFMDSDPAKVTSPSFQSAFDAVYGVKSSQITDISALNNVTFASENSYRGNGMESIKPSTEVSLTTLSPRGMLLPLQYTYSMSWKDVSDILGRNVTSITDINEFFSKVNLVFQDEKGSIVTIVDHNGSSGIGVSDAVSSGVLVYTNVNNGLTLSFSIMVGDLDAVALKPNLINGVLVVADGSANGTLGGDMWLVKKSGSSGDGGGSGGGGCNSGAGVFIAISALICGAGYMKKIKKSN